MSEAGSAASAKSVKRSPDPEMAVMRSVMRAIERLDPPRRLRVLTYVKGRIEDEIIGLKGLPLVGMGDERG